jgi:hypothetical protein
MESIASASRAESEQRRITNPKLTKSWSEKLKSITTWFSLRSQESLCVLCG